MTSKVPYTVQYYPGDGQPGEVRSKIVLGGNMTRFRLSTLFKVDPDSLELTTAPINGMKITLFEESDGGPFELPEDCKTLIVTGTPGTGGATQGPLPSVTKVTGTGPNLAIVCGPQAPPAPLDPPKETVVLQFCRAAINGRTMETIKTHNMRLLTVDVDGICLQTVKRAVYDAYKEVLTVCSGDGRAVPDVPYTHTSEFWKPTKDFLVIREKEVRTRTEVQNKLRWTKKNMPLLEAEDTMEKILDKRDAEKQEDRICEASLSLMSCSLCLGTWKSQPVICKSCSQIVGCQGCVEKATRGRSCPICQAVWLELHIVKGALTAVKCANEFMDKTNKDED